MENGLVDPAERGEAGERVVQSMDLIWSLLSSVTGQTKTLHIYVPQFPHL